MRSKVKVTRLLNALPSWVCMSTGLLIGCTVNQRDVTSPAAAAFTAGAIWQTALISQQAGRWIITTTARPHTHSTLMINLLYAYPTHSMKSLYINTIVFDLHIYSNYKMDMLSFWHWKRYFFVFYPIQQTFTTISLIIVGTLIHCSSIPPALVCSSIRLLRFL